jgi:Tfp pilus assembly protein FimT
METVVTAGIVTILMMIAFPSFRSMSAPFVLRQTEQQIAAEFQRMRMRAIASNTRYRFTYTSSTKTYTVDRETAAGSGTFTTEYRNALPTGASLGNIPTTPIFDSRGMLNAATTIPVSVVGTSHVRTVSINVLGQISFSG